LRQAGLQREKPAIVPTDPVRFEVQAIGVLAYAATACADNNCLSSAAGTAGLSSQPCIWLHPS
jgi:hypothetical protein